MLFALLVCCFCSSFARNAPQPFASPETNGFSIPSPRPGLIADFEQKSGIHVEVLHKNDRTIMSDLDRGT